MIGCGVGVRPYLSTFQVLHSHVALPLLALLVLLLLATAFLDDAEAARQNEQSSDHGDGNDGPGRHCEQNREAKQMAQSWRPGPNIFSERC